MLLLASTSDKLQCITGSASQVEVHASWIDLNTSTFAAINGASRTNTANITTATTTDIVASPGATTTRNVKFLSLFNDHASQSNAIEILHVDGSNNRTLHKTTLLAGELLTLNDLGDWTHYDSNNIPYAQTVKGAVTVSQVTADVSNSTTTAAAITTLTQALAPGTYTFDYRIRHQAAATTTGIKFSCNFTGTQTSFMYWVEAITALATAADGNQSQAVSAAPGGLIEVEAARTTSTAGLTAKLSVDTLNADTMTIIRGLVVVSAAGNLELWHGSEVAAATTVKVGSALIVTKAG